MHRTAAVGLRADIWSAIVSALTVAALVVGWISTNAGVAAAQAPILKAHVGVSDVDNRSGQVAPSAAQKSLVSSIGATARWNRWGTPESLIKYGGYLATGLQGDPVTASRNWIRTNKALFKLSDADVTALELVANSRLAGNAGSVVLFRQKFGNVPSGHDGQIAVAIRDGKIAFVSSSAVGSRPAPASATLTPRQAWTNAAKSVGRTVGSNAITNVRTSHSWTVFDVSGFAQPQRARLTAVPVANGTRPAYETIVLDVKNGGALAATIFVDAQNGAVLMRHNRLNQFALSSAAPQATQFQGSYAFPACGPQHPFPIPAGTNTISAVASSAVITNDIVLKLYINGNLVASQDSPAPVSPEAILQIPHDGSAAAGAVQVCPFTPPVVHLEPTNYAGAVTTNDATVGVPYPPKWKFFASNPKIDLSDTDVRIVGCWVLAVSGAPVAGCQYQLQNLAARFPWDQNTRTNLPNFTTIGNAANTAEAWTTPLTPGATQYRPTSPTREYVFPWTDQWQNSKCSPTVFVPGVGNDIDAAVTNLFSMHNRMHDWSYFLGFTEENFNLQENNFGNTQPGAFPLGRELDPEIGNVQAGAVSGGAPSFLGRDNANQITLNDGVPPITNMYLWQPIAAAFYPPCVDGDYDMAVIGHEYTHAISNRMIAGPDAGILSDQGAAMGESWSDLSAVEYLNEYDFAGKQGEHPFAVGAYATGQAFQGIRNYNMTASPLNYSDVGYDFVCDTSLIDPFDECISLLQVHADGEIWSATNYDLRQALITRWNGPAPASNKTLQKECADGKRNVDQCPGNRRWIQIVFDSFLLMGTPEPSFLTARDAMLAADVLRFNGANQSIMWRVFAKRGMGSNASSVDGNDVDPVGGFETPLETNEATVTFSAIAMNEANAPVKAEVFVGRYEARVTPIADTDPATSLDNVEKFVPGRYEFIARADGYGMLRVVRDLGASQNVNVQFFLPTNWASDVKGGLVITPGINNQLMIDDTEETNARFDDPVSVKNKEIVIKLGTPKQIRQVQISAMLRPFDPDNPTDPDDPTDEDQLSQNRFSALRSFELYACAESATNPGCVNPLGFTKFYTSTADFFPGDKPRPVAPDLIAKSFHASTPFVATHLKLKVLDNQCTGQPQFQGVQDADPTAQEDCVLGSDQDLRVRISEVQAFTAFGGVGAPGDPVVALGMTGPATAAPGGAADYQITYSNAGPQPSQGAKITTTLPAQLQFVSADAGGVYNASTRTVTWNLGTVPVTFTGVRNLKTKVAPGTALGTVIALQASFTGQLTVSPPTAIALTTVLR